MAWSALSFAVSPDRPSLQVGPQDNTQSPHAADECKSQAGQL